ncbi:ATP-binding cassette domain-containing protein [Acinetobacter baumannii]
MKVVPVLVRSDLDEHQVRAARLADNRVAIGDIDTDLLQKELQTLNFDLEGIFDKKELNFVVADLSGMNVDSIVLDLDSEIAKQTEETIKKIEETDARAVRIDKALGFKEIKGKDERFVAQFMAVAEGETGLEGRMHSLSTSKIRWHSDRIQNRQKFDTEVNRSERVLEVAEAFGLGLDDKTFVVFDNLDLPIDQGDIVYITGQSGSGKSTILRELSKAMSADGLSVSDINAIEFEDKPLIDQIGKI